MLHISPEILEQTYELLRVTLPFRRWKLPSPDEIEFRVERHKKNAGSYQCVNGRHIICANGKYHGTLQPLLVVMAHEMCHLYLQINWPKDKAHHGWRFRRLAAQVCKHHVFDPQQFA